jgi:hypothetical protein
MEQTSLEYLWKNYLDNPLSNEDIKYNIEVFEKAKEMHKKEVFDTLRVGILMEMRGFEGLPAEVAFEDYYNQKFNNKW